MAPAVLAAAQVRVEGFAGRSRSHESEDSDGPKLRHTYLQNLHTQLISKRPGQTTCLFVGVRYHRPVPLRTFLVIHAQLRK